MFKEIDMGCRFCKYFLCHKSHVLATAWLPQPLPDLSFGSNQLLHVSAIFCDSLHARALRCSSFPPPECQVFNLYVWESEADEELNLHCVNSFLCSQCQCFRDYESIRLLVTLRPQGVGLVTIQAGWDHNWAKVILCLRSCVSLYLNQLVDTSPLEIVVC